MIVANLKFTTDLDRGVRMTMLRNALFVGDQDAHRFIVSCFRSTSRQPVDLTGAGVTGYFIRADQSTVVIDGKVEDNCAVLTLPAACYAKQGRFSLVIKASLGDVIHTILWVEGAVSVSHTGAIIDPGEVVPTLDELLAQIAAMEQATAAATTATETANAAAAQAVEIATAKGNEALQNVADAVTAQNETIGQLTEDIGEIATDLDAKLLTKAPAIECEASGSLVTVTDAAAQPAVQMMTHIAPVQEGEGDPSPDNVRPISGWDKVTAQRTGKNLCLLLNKTITVAGMTIQLNGGSSFHIDGTGTKDMSSRISENIYLKAGTYTLSMVGANKDSTDYDRLYIFDVNTSEIYINYVQTEIPARFTVPYDTSVGITFIFGTGSTYNNAEIGIQLEPGTTATAYEPYQGQTLTAALPETVYGGTVDWGTGVLTVDRVRYVFTGQEGWAESHIQPNVQPGYVRYDCQVLGVSPSGADEVLSNVYPHNGANKIGVWTNTKAPQFEPRIYWNYATADELKAYLEAQYNAGTPVVAVYKLYKPYTIQLTPQQLEMLRGTNNVWSDTGDTSLVYVADTKMYIDQKLAAIAAATLNN